MGNGYKFETESGKIYEVTAAMEVGERDSVTASNPGAARIEEAKKFGQATVVFITPSQASLFGSTGDIRKQGYTVEVRAIAAETDPLYHGREPLISGLRESESYEHIVQRGGSFHLFARNGKDASLERIDFGEVHFKPQVGLQALVIPSQASEKIRITLPIRTFDMEAPVGRMLRAGAE
jgi:hypothetical protein